VGLEILSPLFLEIERKVDAQNSTARASVERGRERHGTTPRLHAVFRRSEEVLTRGGRRDVMFRGRIRGIGRFARRRGDPPVVETRGRKRIDRKLPCTDRKVEHESGWGEAESGFWLASTSTNWTSLFDGTNSGTTPRPCSTFSRRRSKKKGKKTQK